MPRAGLTRETVVEAGGELADEVGFEQLGMGLLAQRLGVKTPSLYKHVASQADLTHEIAVLAATKLGDAIRDAIRDQTGINALAGGARAMRDFAREHPGLYAAGNAALLGGSEDPLRSAGGRVMEMWAEMICGYRLEPHEQIHAQRLLRSTFHGFAALEAIDGFQLDAPVDESFGWIVQFIGRGLEASRTPPAYEP